jgi:hypothetical protein
LIPRKGKRFCIIDLSQIEPRCLNWIICNEALLSKVREGMAIYEAFARTSSGWTGGNLKKADKKKYALAKANVLALGYGAGWKKFITMALMPMYGNLDLCAEDDSVSMLLSLDKKYYVEEKVVENGQDIFLTKEYDAAKHGVSDKALRKRFIVIRDPDTGLAVRENVYGVNARVIVAHFRKSNPLIAGEEGIWKQLDNLLKASAAKGEDCVVEIAGRSMTWRNCRLEKRRKTDKETGETYTKTEVRYDQGCPPTAARPRRICVSGSPVTYSCIAYVGPCWKARHSARWTCMTRPCWKLMTTARLCGWKKTEKKKGLSLTRQTTPARWVA